MNVIKLLPESLRNQIAAGEVIERPASIIKELVENSIDANATNISVSLEQAGMIKIEVKDNGKGINKDDLTLAIARHATSKITNKEDLFNINTLGFRGEALASIASVSLFTLASKIANDLAGQKIEVQAGKEQSNQPYAMNTGTLVEVKDLFFNLPARKKFLKSLTVELKHCVDVVENFAFCHPFISFILSHNGKTILKLTPSDLQSRINELVSTEVKDSLIPIFYDADTIKITGFVSKPGIAFKTRNNQKIFVNNRGIKDNTIAGAINQAYYSFLEHGSFPAYYIFITIPADLIDVNVHPTKNEVRFMHSQEVFQGVKNAIIYAFAKKNQASDSSIANQILNFTTNTSNLDANHPVNLSDNLANNLLANSSSNKSSLPVNSKFNYQNSQNSYSAFSKPSSAQVKSALDFSKLILTKPESLSSLSTTNTVNLPAIINDELLGYKIIGQALNKFILLEKDEEIIFLDQHAVHERLRYDRFKYDLQHKKINSQRLLLPEIIKCQFNEFITIQEHLDWLQLVGFELSEFGNNTWQVLAIPSQLEIIDLKEILLKICEELGESSYSNEIDNNTEKALIYLSCRGAVKFGDNLKDDEIKAVVKDWLHYAQDLTCPHGRPLSFSIKSKDLEKKMGRY